MKNKTKFNWACYNCGKRNLVAYKFQFDMPKYYTVEDQCGKCGKESLLTFTLGVEPKPREKKNE